MTERRICKKAFACAVALLLLCAQPLSAFATAVNPAFNPDIIVPDTVFSDTKTFSSPADIQRFLESKGSILANRNIDFVNMLREPTDAAVKTGLGDPEPN